MCNMFMGEIPDDSHFLLLIYDHSVQSRIRIQCVKKRTTLDTVRFFAEEYVTMVCIYIYIYTIYIYIYITCHQFLCFIIYFFFKYLCHAEKCERRRRERKEKLIWPIRRAISNINKKSFLKNNAPI